MSLRDNLHSFAMAVWGPAQSGPYGPPTTPPPPRPRDARGRLLKRVEI